LNLEFIYPFPTARQYYDFVNNYL